MAWHQLLFSFQGRLNRQGFWIGFGVNFAFLFIFANFFLNSTAFSWVSLLPLLLSIYSLAAIITKRLHDRNRSGKAGLIVIVPIICYASSFYAQGTMAWLLGLFMPMLIGTLLLLEWGVFAGNPTPNNYGDKGLSVKPTSL
ncbi:uncharacterized membrane protein YhaH (DUF805 family) [Nicoletella semolina]|uniref:Uncharacterized membrane protein YhaH (DUF805 family) n=1 Tax=Nicoletella semolina TaxID=271160 RepID=A0A4R2NBW7_9PAST|nr:DUF805 domain-containing protein [Nicoletella semolina]MDH2924985.1 hypothetical protein [Nicoletella semolina]TCP18534.1 uncharacterized membrane protein YhaH (DUF805 family) [Nicoletella semolina]